MEEYKETNVGKEANDSDKEKEYQEEQRQGHLKRLQRLHQEARKCRCTNWYG